MELAPGVVELWDRAGRRPVARLEDPYGDQGTWISFTPDGARLVVLAPYARTIHLWDLGSIRDGLDELGLDWDEPPLPRPAPAGTVVHLRVDPGELAESVARRRRAETARLAITEGNALGRPGHWTDALAAFQRAIDADPEDTTGHNNIAWLLVTCPDPALRNTERALEYARRAVERGPLRAANWNTLGVALYRAGKWQESIRTLEKAEEVEPGRYTAFNGFFLAMAHQRLGNSEVAREWFERAVNWRRTNHPQDEELQRFQAEAEELSGR
jgi:tetratricopeptide (TPR) repeat protein